MNIAILANRSNASVAELQTAARSRHVVTFVPWSELAGTIGVGGEQAGVPDNLASVAAEEQAVQAVEPLMEALEI